MLSQSKPAQPRRTRWRNSPPHSQGAPRRHAVSAHAAPLVSAETERLMEWAMSKNPKYFQRFRERSLRVEHRFITADALLGPGGAHAALVERCRCEAILICTEARAGGGLSTLRLVLLAGTPASIALAADVGRLRPPTRDAHAAPPDNSAGGSPLDGAATQMAALRLHEREQQEAAEQQRRRPSRERRPPARCGRRAVAGRRSTKQPLKRRPLWRGAAASTARPRRPNRRRGPWRARGPRRARTWWARWARWRGAVSAASSPDAGTSAHPSSEATVSSEGMAPRFVGASAIEQQDESDDRLCVVAATSRARTRWCRAATGACATRPPSSASLSRAADLPRRCAAKVRITVRARTVVDSRYRIKR